MGAILDAAIEYAEAGYAVIPVKRSDKAPYTPNGLADASKDADTLRQWWQRWPEANVAVVCGHVSGDLFVIDIDIKPEKGKHGDEELLKWQAKYGDFPETVKQRTGSGGQHQFFRDPNIALYKNKVNAIPGIDVRGEGSYVVVAPSVYEDGSVYEWEGASILDTIEVADANESVTKLLALNPRDQKGETSLQERETISMKDVPEGVLSKNRADVVREESLADAARDIGLGDYIYMGKGEETTGGRDKDSILADAFEALIGAIIVDGGYEAGKKIILGLLNDKIGLAVAGKLRHDYKTMLQEKLQEKNHDLRIKYNTVSESGPDHNKTFNVEVVIGNRKLGRGSGKSKSKAEQEAARDALASGKI